MAISGVDAYGAFIDTGVGVAVTPRANVEVEIHQVTEIDSGSKISPTTVATTHIPHRGKDSPR